jgi:hypothetical protein
VRNSEGKFEKTHGMFGTQTYSSWQSMLARCYSDKSPSYSNYGGRGIRVCKEWWKFENFFLDMGVRLAGTTLEIIDTNKDYSKDNCVWASQYEQSRNKRNTLMVSHNGEIKCAKDWSIALGIPYASLRRRFLRGMPIDQEIPKPKLKLDSNGRFTKERMTP